MKILQGEDARLRSRDFFEHLPAALLVRLEQRASVTFRVSLRVTLRTADRDRHVRRRRIDGTIRDRIGNSWKRNPRVRVRVRRRTDLRESVRRYKNRRRRCCSR